MANIKSAIKRAKQSLTRRTRNTSTLSALKTTQKKLSTALAGGPTDEAAKQYRDFASALDKAAKKGVIHKNSANRRKASFGKVLRNPA